MTENLLTPSVIKLFGRRLNDLQFNYDSATVVTGYNNFLQRQLNAGGVSVSVNGVTILGNTTVTTVSTLVGLAAGMTVSATSAGAPVFSQNTIITSIGPGPAPEFVVSVAPILSVPNGVTITATLPRATVGFARIYGFSFEGAYYGLPRPSIFLVHGNGTPTGNWAYPSTVEQSGVAAREWDFSGPTGFTAAPPQNLNPGGPPLDICFWEYEKGDFSLRLDPEAGPFEQILLVAALRAGADMADRATPSSGAGLGVRSGAGLSCAGVSGAGLSGAGLSGAGLSGAGLSGAGLRGR
jgi:hypothetical protein